jgi:hypothetical protein
MENIWLRFYISLPIINMKSVLGEMMLRDKERLYLEHDRPRYLKKTKPAHIRKRDADIRNKSRKAIEYLEYLAIHLDPDQHKQVFNEKTILPLIQAIFSRSNPDWKTDPETSQPPIYDLRLLNLAIIISNECLNKSSNLINPKIRPLTKDFLPDPSRLRLLYLLIESLRPEDVKNR